MGRSRELLNKLSLSSFRKTLEGFSAHQLMVKETVGLLAQLTEALMRHEQDTVVSLSEKISLIERRADEVRREIESKISAGELFLGLREDYLKLIDQVDKIASAAKDAARTVALRKIKDEELTALLERGFDVVKMAKRVVKIVEALMNVINLLNVDYEEAFNGAHEVEKEEEALDELKIEALKKLQECEGLVEPITYMQLREFVLQVDEVADCAEDVADVVAIMVAKAKA